VGDGIYDVAVVAAVMLAMACWAWVGTGCASFTRMGSMGGARRMASCCGLEVSGIMKNGGLLVC
jgi:hypothetical protein